jgi:hypothetical protein
MLVSDPTVSEMVFFPGVVNSRQTLTMGDLGEEATTHTRNSSSTSQVSITINVRGVLGNKCAGQHNLKPVHFRDTLASGNFLAWSSAVCVFFCSALSTLGRRQ